MIMTYWFQGDKTFKLMKLVTDWKKIITHLKFAVKVGLLRTLDILSFSFMAQKFLQLQPPWYSA